MNIFDHYIDILHCTNSRFFSSKFVNFWIFYFRDSLFSIFLLSNIDFFGVLICRALLFSHLLFSGFFLELLFFEIFFFELPTLYQIDHSGLLPRTIRTASFTIQKRTVAVFKTGHLRQCTVYMRPVFSNFTDTIQSIDL